MSTAVILEREQTPKGERIHVRIGTKVITLTPEEPMEDDEVIAVAEYLHKTKLSQ